MKIIKTRYPLISIIISNYNGDRLNILRECLESFKKNDYPNFELILIDNASDDGSIKTAREVFGKEVRFKIIQNPINMYSQGINLGFEEAQGEYIALFNNDIELGKGYLKKLVKAFNKYPDLGVVQGKLLWQLDPKIIDSVGESMDIYGNPVTVGYQKKDTGQFEKDREVLSATGAACLIKRSALEKVGGYEVDFGIGYEDMDHSLRFRSKGFKIMTIPEAVCYHKRGVTDLSDMVKVAVRWHFSKNRLATMIRNYPLSLLIKALPLTLLIYIGSMIWEFFAYKDNRIALARPKAIIWILKNFPKLYKERMLIRKNASNIRDKKTLKLFAPTDILGKIKAVILDRIRVDKIIYSLPWTYPSEIRNLIPKNSTILDVGCGDGHLMEWINYFGEYEVTGIDINKQDLNTAKERLNLYGKPIYKKLIVGDLTKKIAPGGKYDIVLCSQVVEHLTKEKALDLIKSLEKYAKRRVIVATINGFFQFDHRAAGKYDLHLSGWSPEDFYARGYKVSGSGLKLIYKPGALKDKIPVLNPLFFIISYFSTPLVRVFKTPALLIIANKKL